MSQPANFGHEPKHLTIKQHISLTVSMLLGSVGKVVHNTDVVYLNKYKRKD